MTVIELPNCDHTGQKEVDKDGIYDETKGFFACGRCGKFFEYEESLTELL